MDSFVSKHYYYLETPYAVKRSYYDSTPTTPFSAKRRRLPPPLATFIPPPPPQPVLPPIDPQPGEILFRILCPSSQAGSVIGKGGARVRRIREETGAAIRVEDLIPGCDERVIVIVGDSESPSEGDSRDDNVGGKGGESGLNLKSESAGSQAQRALGRVYQRILDVGEESEEKGLVVCRLLATSSEAGSVIGRGGKVVKQIKRESGAQIRVLANGQVPVCAAPGDELIQITGGFQAVWKALLSVSTCLQDNSRISLSEAGIKSSEEDEGDLMEEEVVFKLLCQVDKVGSLIGKGGSIIRGLQTETGASIKIADEAPDSDERVVVISARETSEQRHSPAQEAVIRVHSRIAEIGFEAGAAVVARLLVHPQQIGCLLGKEGAIIAELRRATGASIRLFPKEQVTKYGYQNDEVVQVIGSLQSVQDALFHITSRLRDAIFPPKPYAPSPSGSAHLRPYQETPSPHFRPRHDPVSPGQYHSTGGIRRGFDHVAGPPHQPFDTRSYLHGGDHVRPAYMDRPPYAYSERPGHGPSFDQQSSPGGRLSQAVGRGNSAGVAEVGGSSAHSNPVGRETQAPNAAPATVKMGIPNKYLSFVHTNHNDIMEMSGAKLVIYDPEPGTSFDGVVVITGTPKQVDLGQTLVHAFILKEKWIGPSKT